MEEIKIIFDQIKENDFDVLFNSSFEEDKQFEKVLIVVKLSLFFNIVLMIVKVVVLYFFGFMFIFFSLVDSIVDLVLGVVVWYISCVVKSIDYYKYFVGKIRLELISIIVL